MIANNENPKQDREIIYYRKAVYGSVLLYPVNEVAKIFCHLDRAKSLTSHVINHAMQLGYTMKEILQP